MQVAIVSVGTLRMVLQGSLATLNFLQALLILLPLLLKIVQLLLGEDATVTTVLHDLLQNARVSQDELEVQGLQPARLSFVKGGENDLFHA